MTDGTNEEEGGATSSKSLPAAAPPAGIMTDSTDGDEGGATGGVVVYQPDRHITVKRVTQSEWDSARLMGVGSSVKIAAASVFFTAFLAVAFEASRSDSVALWLTSFVVLTASLVFVVLLVLDWRAWKRLNELVDARSETP